VGFPSATGEQRRAFPHVGKVHRAVIVNATAADCDNVKRPTVVLLGNAPFHVRGAVSQ
jgi:hypothetical protein